MTPAIRDATRDDLPAIVRLLADDPLGATRETYARPLPACYEHAFEAIQDDPHNTVIVAENGVDIVGTLQLTYIPNLTYRGGMRAQIEGVRVAASQRGTGLGRRLVEEAIDRARQRGCRLVQLTTDANRPEAVAFYAAIGFKASHVGMKYPI